MTTTKYHNDMIIRVLVQDNPKLSIGVSRERFAQYRDGMTVGQYRDLVGSEKATADFRWDIRHGYIRLENAYRGLGPSLG